jgi:aminoglycoside phosphotransferase (APT) family kinase protein
LVVTEYGEGEVLTDALPASMSQHPDVVRRVDLALLDAAADLHVVDVNAAASQISGTQRVSATDKSLAEPTGGAEPPQTASAR